MIRPAEAHRKLVIQFLKFGTIGGFGFFVDLGFFHLGLDIFGFGHYGSAVFSFPFAATFTWIGNRLFTFRGKHAGRASTQWARFLVTCAIGFVINRGTFSLLTAAIPLVYRFPVLGLMAGTGTAMFFNFFAARKLVFR
jgi:putative flippase GtrA